MTAKPDNLETIVAELRQRVHLDTPEYTPGQTICVDDIIARLIDLDEYIATSRPRLYFAANPAEGCFDEYATLKQAISAADAFLDETRELAADFGWIDEPPQICYGILLGACEERFRGIAPMESKCDEIADFKLAPLSETESWLCACGLPTCVEPWEEGCGLGTHPDYARPATPEEMAVMDLALTPLKGKRQ